NLPGFASSSRRENDLFPIGRPAWQASSLRRIGELKPLAAIHFAPPQTALRVGHINHPRSIPRKIQLLCRYTWQIAGPLLRLHIVASQLAALLFSHEEKLFAIPARYRRIVVQRPEGQLPRL